MIDVSWFQLIGIILGSGGLASLAASFITLRYVKLKEKGVAIQELKKAENLDINNTKEIIDLYKQGMKDLQDIMNDREITLSKKLSEYEAKIHLYESENSKLNKLVDQLRNAMISLQTRLDSITLQSLQDCNKCSFKSGCNKYKAKLYIKDDMNKDENQVNGKDILSNC